MFRTCAMAHVNFFPIGNWMMLPGPLWPITRRPIQLTGGPKLKNPRPPQSNSTTPRSPSTRCHLASAPQLPQSSRSLTFPAAVPLRHHIGARRIASTLLSPRPAPSRPPLLLRPIAIYSPNSQFRHLVMFCLPSTAITLAASHTLASSACTPSRHVLWILFDSLMVVFKC